MKELANGWLYPAGRGGASPDQQVTLGEASQHQVMPNVSHTSNFDYHAVAYHQEYEKSSLERQSMSTNASWTSTRHSLK